MICASVQEVFHRPKPAGSIYKNRSKEKPFGRRPRDIGAFIEVAYDRRLHSAIGHEPPVEFEDELCPVAPTPNEDEAPSLD
ncbi:MAG: hypothetical protein ACLPGW_05535 [Roseiarcus sp.]